jgi:hypothetical protein
MIDDMKLDTDFALELGTKHLPAAINYELGRELMEKMSELFKDKENSVTCASVVLNTLASVMAAAARNSGLDRAQFESVIAGHVIYYQRTMIGAYESYDVLKHDFVRRNN